MAAAIVLSGNSTAWAQDSLLEVSGTVPNGWFGHCVAAAGDIDGDGTPDLMVGTPKDSTAAYQGGSVSILSGATGALLQQHWGNHMDGMLGHSVAGVGDLDGDGFPDFAVGAPTADLGSIDKGMVVVRSGSTGSSIYGIFGPSALGRTGYAIASAGDVNQDGVPDLVVGSPGDRTVGDSAGRAAVHDGANGQIRWEVFGAAIGERLGFAVSGGADVNGDGQLDIAIGVPGRSPSSGLVYAGAIEVRGGNAGVHLYTEQGVAPMDYVGESLDIRGDLDLDGRADLLFGIRRRSGQSLLTNGVVRAVSPSTQATLLNEEGLAAHEEFGTAVAYLGDVDQDGIDDVIAGAPLGGAAGYASGVVRVISGGSSHVLFPFHAKSHPELLGRSVARVGDLNQDGRPDFVVGARRTQTAKPDVGRIYAVSGVGCAAGSGYGSGCPGTGGFVPVLQRVGCAVAGSWLTLSLNRGLGGAAAFVTVGVTPAMTPLGAGCTLWVSGPNLILGPFPLGGAGPGTGDLALSVSIPPFATYPDLVAQGFVADAAAALGFSASNAASFDLSVSP